MGLAQACQILVARGEFEEAQQAAVEIRSFMTSHRTRHRATVVGLHCAASAYEKSGDPDQAIPLREEEVVVERAKHGPTSSVTVAAMEMLAVTVCKAGDTSRAIELLRDVTEKWRVLEGVGSTRGLHWLGKALFEQGDIPEAQEVFEHVVNTLGASNPEGLVAGGWLAACHSRQGDVEGALAIREETLLLAERAYGFDDRRTLHHAEQVAALLGGLQRREQAQALLQRVLAARERIYGDDDPETHKTKEQLQALLDELP
jgi:tetratricopeptide (TPR) repeat protein